MAWLLRSIAFAMSFLFVQYFCSCPAADAQAVIGPDWATKLVLYNASNSDVTIMIKMGAGTQDGCPNKNVSTVKIYNLTDGSGPTSLVMFTDAYQGWYQLKRGHKVQVVSTGLSPKTKAPTYCLANLQIGFGQIGNSCADFGSTTTDFPDTRAGAFYNRKSSPPIPLLNGSVAFEGTLNLPGTINGVAQGANQQEAVDITCLSGANATLIAQFVPPIGGPYWNYDLGPQSGGVKYLTAPFTIQNSWVKIDQNPAKGCDDNCVDPKTGQARPGVFPYGCSQCNVFPDIKPQCGVKAPPPVVGSNGPYASQYCAAKNSTYRNNGCTMARNTGGTYLNNQKFGGTIQVTYAGPLSPPSTACSR